jgi:hypothetical protein
MLNKKESLLMTEIYLEAEKKKGSCLIKPIELLSRIPYSIDFKLEELDSTLQNLVYDEYIELIETDKKGEPYLLINLLKKGKAFKREIEQKKRQTRYSLLIKIIGAVLATIIGIVLKKLLTK